MRLYLVRHGQTNFNSMRLIQGRVDAPLNLIGKKQAKTAGQTLKGLNVKFDHIISSPLSRALETGYLVGKKINFKEHIIINNGFIERDFGNYELTKIADNFPKIMTQGFNEEGFEDDNTLLNRVHNTLKQLYINNKDKNVIITTHAHIIRTFYILFDNHRYTYTNFFLGNGSIHVFEYDGKNLNLIETHLNEE
ncbi:MAG: histidine phosphatase family protein [Acholeplasma sp.]|nr:histidine phosphatase family protein [Acholeplasma sp.]